MKLDAQIAYAKLFLEDTPAKDFVIESLEELQKIRLIKNIFFTDAPKEAQAEENEEIYGAVERLREIKNRLRNDEGDVQPSGSSLAANDLV